jgi:putative copper export protein
MDIRAARPRSANSGELLAGLGAAALALTPALSGHAVAAENLRALAVLADTLHVVGAGGWMGGLLVLLVVGVPAALRLASPERGPGVAVLVNAFSPTALFFAALTVGTGLFAAWLNLGGSVSALWESGYGRTLLLKLAVVSVVFFTGAYNWLRVRPALGTEVAAGKLRRSAAVELAAGMVVIVITAVLVASSPP